MPLYYAAALFTPSIAVFATFIVWRWRRNQKPGRPPIAEKLLRPAGESLRLKIDDLNEKLGDALGLALLVPAIPLVFPLAAFPAGQIPMPLASLAFAVCAVLVIVLLRRVFAIATELRQHRMGFHAERAVAEEINQLMRDGCHVFHDVPMQPYGNIDHVIVSPTGVFAVETKSRQKLPAPKGKRECDAIFDGEGVEFPTWRDVDMVKQAKMQGERLRAFLTSAVGEPVDVLPILTLPGWYVTTSKRPGGMRVLNPKMIKSVAVDARATKLPPEMIQRIAHQLEQKCRDVEL